jgi:hypothetical protein
MITPHVWLNLPANPSSRYIVSYLPPSIILCYSWGKEGKYMLFTCQFRVCLVARANLECLSLMIHDDPSQVELRYITCLAPTDVLSYAHMRCCLVPFMLRWACTISVLQIHPPYYQKGPQTKKEKSNRVHSIGASLPAANWGEAATIGGTAWRWEVGLVEEFRFLVVGSPASI